MSPTKHSSSKPILSAHARRTLLLLPAPSVGRWRRRVGYVLKIGSTARGSGCRRRRSSSGTLSGCDLLGRRPRPRLRARHVAPPDVVAMAEPVARLPRTARTAPLARARQPREDPAACCGPSSTSDRAATTVSTPTRVGQSAAASSNTEAAQIPFETSRSPAHDAGVRASTCRARADGTRQVLLPALDFARVFDDPAPWNAVRAAARSSTST